MARRSDPVTVALSYIRYATERVARARSRLDPVVHDDIIDRLDDIIARLNRVYDMLIDEKLDGEQDL